MTTVRSIADGKEAAQVEWKDCLEVAQIEGKIVVAPGANGSKQLCKGFHGEGSHPGNLRKNSMQCPCFQRVVPRDADRVRRRSVMP